MRRLLLSVLVWSVSIAAGASTLLEIRADNRGMFYVDGAVGNAPLRFLMDTGANGVTVPRTVANQAGEYGPCRWVRNSTANGVIDSCMRKVSSIRIGTMTLRDIEVLITTDESTSSGLIGMSVMRLFRVEMEKGVMRISD